MTPANPQDTSYAHDVYEGNPDIHPGGEFEGVIDIGVTEEEDKLSQGHPIQLRYWKPGVEDEQVVKFNTFG